MGSVYLTENNMLGLLNNTNAVKSFSGAVGEQITPEVDNLALDAEVEVEAELSDNTQFIVEVSKPHIAIADTLARTFNYGDLVPHEWLSEMFNLKIPEYGTKKQYDKYAIEYMNLLEGVKSHLLETHKMYLSNVKGKGYLIIVPNQQAEVVIKKMRSVIHKELGKAKNAILNINDALLSNSEVLRKDAEHGRIAALSAFVRKNK